MIKDKTTPIAVDSGTNQYGANDLSFHDHKKLIGLTLPPVVYEFSAAATHLATVLVSETTQLILIREINSMLELYI